MVLMTSLLPARRAACALAGLLAATLLVGCNSAPPKRAPPVVDRSPVITPAVRPRPLPPPAPPVAPPAEAVAPAVPLVKPGPEHRGLPGYYTVKPGDTLLRIGLDQGQNWRDIARWSLLDNPNKLEIGQVLRVRPPEPVPVAAAPAAPAPTGNPVAVSSPVLDSTLPPPSPAAEPRPPAEPAAPVQASASAPGVTLVATPPPNTAGALSAPPAAASAPLAGPGAAAAPAEPTSAPAPEEELGWAWPSGGPVLAGFEETRSKGVVLGGKPGDPVLAAADGRVVYAGSGLRGYGNLVIIKHNSTYLSAYAHNQLLLVKEDQTVRRGQRIAEMGSSDAERVQLHFEIRKQGKPTDPSRLLPPR